MTSIQALVADGELSQGVSLLRKSPAWSIRNLDATASAVPLRSGKNARDWGIKYFAQNGLFVVRHRVQHPRQPEPVEHQSLVVVNEVPEMVVLRVMRDG